MGAEDIAVVQPKTLAMGALLSKGNNSVDCNLCNV